MRRLKGVRIVNPISMMGLARNPPKTGEELKVIWGPDPVHPSPTAYKTMAENIIMDLGCQPTPQATSALLDASGSQRPPHVRPEKRESWTSRTQLVADRKGKWSANTAHNSGHFRGRGRGRGRPYVHRVHGSRGGKFPRPY